MLILPTGAMLILNSICFLKVSHRKRIIIMICLNAVACLSYGKCLIDTAVFSAFSASDKYAFYICLIASLVSGICQALGEGVMISFIKKFDSRCIAGWSSGTGFAGLLGSGLFLLLRAVNTPISTIFYCIAPLEIVYGVLFIWLENNRPHRSEFKLQILNDNMGGAEVDLSVNTDKIEEPQASNLKIVEIDEKRNVELTCSSMRPLFGKVWWSCLNLGLVYFLEYAVLVGFADVLTRSSNIPFNPNFFEKNAYRIMSFMYQIGVTLSRSSMYCFKVSKWHILTAIQAINFTGWFILAGLNVNQIYVEFVWMIFVGLIGGCSYVNVYYFTLELNTDLSNEQKEVAINMIILSTDVFSTLATLFALLLSNTLFKQ